jgi:hypothetical protein
MIHRMASRTDIGVIEITEGGFDEKDIIQARDNYARTGTSPEEPDVPVAWSYPINALSSFNW